MIPLRDYLLEAYGGFADRRIKDPSHDRPIKVDDRGTGDVYPRFCTISVSVPDRRAEDLILRLQHAPLCPEVVSLVEGLGGTARTTGPVPSIVLPLKSSQGPAITRLAGAIKASIGRGRNYGDSNLKWICKRTATSLEALAEHLDDYRTLRDEGREAGRPDPILARRRQSGFTTGHIAGSCTSNGTLAGGAGDHR